MVSKTSVVRSGRGARSERKGERERSVREGAEAPAALVPPGRGLDGVAVGRVRLQAVRVERVDAVGRGRPARVHDVRRGGVAPVGAGHEQPGRALDGDARPDAGAARGDGARPHPVDRRPGALHRGQQPSGAGRIDGQAGRGEARGAGEHRPPSGAGRGGAGRPPHRVGPSGRDSSHHFESWWRARVGWSV